MKLPRWGSAAGVVRPRGQWVVGSGTGLTRRGENGLTGVEEGNVVDQTKRGKHRRRVVAVRGGVGNQSMEKVQCSPLVMYFTLYSTLFYVFSVVDI